MLQCNGLLRAEGVRENEGGVTGGGRRPCAKGHGCLSPPWRNPEMNREPDVVLRAYRCRLEISDFPLL